MEPMILKQKRPWRVLLVVFLMALAGAGTGHAQTQNQAAVPGAGAKTAVANAAGEAGNEAAEAFARSGVYVAPDMRSLADTAQLEAAVQSALVPVKVAVIGALPPGSRTVPDFAQTLHGQLQLDHGLMIVVCDRPRALGLYGGNLEAPALGDIAARTAKTFDSEGYATGVTRVISLVSEENGRRLAAQRTIILVAVGVPGVLLFWFFKRTRRVRLREAGAARTVAEGEQARLRGSADKLAHELSEAIALESDAGRRGRLHSALDGAQAALAAAKRPLEQGGSAKDWNAKRAELRATGEQLQRSQFVLAQARIAREANEARVEEAMDAVNTEEETDSETTSAPEAEATEEIASDLEFEVGKKI